MEHRKLVSSAAAWMILATLLAPTLAPAGQKPKQWNPVIVPADFSSVVDNPYFPLTPGQTMSYRSETKSGIETLDIEVRQQTKMITGMGVTARVVIETAALDGQVIEIAENWFAQDKDGNVWYFGESTQEFDHGVPGSTAGSWEAGVDDASPGIIMKAHPETGDTYFQEFAEVAQDMASVVKTDDSVVVPHGSYERVLRTKEWTPLEPNSVEHKYYAPGLGLIKEEKGGEDMVLVSIH